MLSMREMGLQPLQQFVALHRDLPFVEMLTVWFLLLVYQIEHVQAIAQLKQNTPTTVNQTTNGVCNDRV